MTQKIEKEQNKPNGSQRKGLMKKKAEWKELENVTKKQNKNLVI